MQAKLALGIKKIFCCAEKKKKNSFFSYLFFYYIIQGKLRTLGVTH